MFKFYLHKQWKSELLSPINFNVRILYENDIRNAVIFQNSRYGIFGFHSKIYVH